MILKQLAAEWRLLLPRYMVKPEACQSGFSIHQDPVVRSKQSLQLCQKSINLIKPRCAGCEHCEACDENETLNAKWSNKRLKQIYDKVPHLAQREEKMLLLIEKSTLGNTLNVSLQPRYDVKLLIV